MRDLLADKIIDPVTEGHCAFISSLGMAAGLHRHDFHEFFLVTEGEADHLVNNAVQNLGTGSLVYIRPSDQHCYRGKTAEPFSFINLAFSDAAARRCFDYLAGCGNLPAIMQAVLPPQTILQGPTLLDTITRLQDWNTIPLQQTEAKRLALRSLLITLFSEIMRTQSVQPRQLQPVWLTDLLIAMRHKENMTAGLAAMRSLSGKSHEHLCRALRRYTGQSPSAYVNRLRLFYAANLLVNSDMTVLDVLLESGFDNASYFNRCFKACYGCTPRQFRSSRQNSLF